MTFFNQLIYYNILCSGYNFGYVNPILLFYWCPANKDKLLKASKLQFILCFYNKLLQTYITNKAVIFDPIEFPKHRACRGKCANVKRNFSSVSQGVYIANMVISCIKLIFGVNTFK